MAFFFSYLKNIAQSTFKKTERDRNAGEKDEHEHCLLLCHFSPTLDTKHLILGRGDYTGGGERGRERLAQGGGAQREG